jgi:hypothetical protein
MKAVKHPGKCKICGEFKDLSPEHIPPKNAFNSTTVKIFPFEEMLKTVSEKDRLPWDTKGLKGSLQQGGHKKYCLCHACNNNTGQWYMRSYTDLAKTINAMIVKNRAIPGRAYSFTIEEIYPLRIYKAMMTLMCDINNDCFGDVLLRDFIMNKNSISIDKSKYSLYMYLVSSHMPRISGLSAFVNAETDSKPVLVSEIAYYPIGFALYIDKPQNYNPFGLNVDVFADYGFDDKCEVTFSGIPYLDINSNFPADYRSKEEIIECIKTNELNSISS